MPTSSGARALAATAAVAATLLLPAPAQAAPLTRAPLSRAAQAGTIGVVDVTPDGSPGDGGIGGSDISDDGRYIAFASTSGDLVPGDGNGQTTDIFVRDTRTGTTTLVSGGLDGQPANDYAEYAASISGNGRYVVFTSSASNLVPGDTNNQRDVFVHDVQAGTTTRASVFAGDREIPGISDSPTVSDNGRYVAFLVNPFSSVMDDQGVWIGGQTAFVHDLKTGRTTRVSVQADGGTDLDVFQVAIAGNGTRVAFSGSGDWIGDGGTDTGVFVRDLSSGTTVRANVPAPGEALRDGTNPSINRDGTKVSWESFYPYVPADTNSATDVYVRDLSAGTTTLVSANRKGTGAGDLYSSAGRLAASGRYVAFYSSASDLVAHDVNGNVSDVFVRDVTTGRTVAASSSAAGTTGNNDSFDGAVSADGSRVVFRSSATDLGADAGDGYQHLFVRCLRDCVTG
jgi:hypothetical protein